MTQRQPISTAPRNGLTVIVGDDDCGQFAMCWNAGGTNPLAQEHNGIWESLDRSFTWSEADGAGPTYWFPLPEGFPSADGAPLRVKPLSSTDGKPS